MLANTLYALYNHTNFSFLLTTHHRTEIDKKFQELVLAEREREMEWDKYVPMDGKMDRHEDIRPCAHNRVKLQVSENKPDSINTSPTPTRPSS